MFRYHPKAGRWFAGAVCGLFALSACQKATEEAPKPPAPEAASKVAVEAAAPATPAEAKPTTPASPPRTVRSPKVTAPVDEIPFQGKRIAIVHTANVIGELEPCG